MKPSNLLYLAGFASIIFSAVNYIEGKTSRGDDKQHDGNFIGHWAPTFFILGKIAEDRENQANSSLSNS
ncbi:hypothetical protein [Deinococcus sonorensis]|uniref:Uncharacterized protein n=2 Tax=Deinococcus sonorensis TaxID=309891 RepID=A0AAU7UBJ1_9DEIO